MKIKPVELEQIASLLLANYQKKALLIGKAADAAI